MDNGPGVNWDDIAGLEFAKKNIKEIVVWPMLRPWVLICSTVFFFNIIIYDYEHFTENKIVLKIILN